MARLETAFESAGHSAETAKSTYQDLYGILGDEGAATEAAQQLAKFADTEEEMAASTRILTGVMAEYGASIPTEGLAEGMAATAAMGEVQGVLADALEWQGVNLEEYNAKLAEMATEEERSAYIQQTLTDLYGESADAFAEKNKAIIEAREAEAALSQATAELGAIAEPIMTQLKLLAVDLLGSITPFVSLIGEGLTGALSGASDASSSFAEGISGILNVLLEKATQILPSVLQMLGELVPSVVNTLLSAAPQLLTVITDLAVQVINMLSTVLPQILAKIVEILPLLINSLISAVPQLLQAATTLLLAIVQAIPTLVSSLVSSLPTIAQTIISALISSIPILLEAAISLLNAIVEAIPVLIQSLTQNLPQIITTIIDGIVEAVPLLLEAAITLLFAIIDAIPVILKELWSATPQIISAIAEALLDGLPKILKCARDLFDQLLEAAGDLIKKLPSKAGEIISAIAKGLGDGISTIASVGKDIVEGLWNGISDMAGWIGKKIKGFGESVLGGIKDFFGIASPSKLMRDEVGNFIGQGIGVGILDSMPDVKKQLGKFSSFISDNIGDIKTGLSLDMGGNIGSASSKDRNSQNGSGRTVVDARMTINYNGALSRKKIKQLENDQYTAIRTKLKAEGAI